MYISWYTPTLYQEQRISVSSNTLEQNPRRISRGSRAVLFVVYIFFGDFGSSFQRIGEVGSCSAAPPPEGSYGYHSFKLLFYSANALVRLDCHMPRPASPGQAAQTAIAMWARLTSLLVLSVGHVAVARAQQGELVAAATGLFEVMITCGLTPYTEYCCTKPLSSVFYWSRAVVKAHVNIRQLLMLLPLLTVAAIVPRPSDHALLCRLQLRSGFMQQKVSRPPLPQRLCGQNFVECHRSIYM